MYGMYHGKNCGPAVQLHAHPAPHKSPWLWFGCGGDNLGAPVSVVYCQTDLAQARPLEKKTEESHIIPARDPKQCGEAKGDETSGGDDDDDDTRMRAQRSRHMRAHESTHMSAQRRAHIGEHIYESTHMSAHRKADI